MTKIINSGGSGKIVFDHEDWLAGEDKFKPTSGVYDKLGNGIYSSSNVNTTKYLGYITAGYKATIPASASVISATLKKGVVYPNASNDCFAIESGTKLHIIDDFETGAIRNDGTFPYTVSSGNNNLILDDIEIYYTTESGTTSDKVFYSYNDDAGWNVGVCLAGTPYTCDIDFLTTVPSTPLADNWGGVATNDYIALGKGLPHPLCVGNNDILYIGSGRYLHAYDGTNNIFSAEVLKLPRGYIITGITRTSNNFLAIAAYYNKGSSNGDSGNAKVWYWDYLNLDPTYVYNLHDHITGDIFEWNGTVACMTRGQKTGASSGYTKLQILSSGEFIPFVTIDNVLPVRGGIFVNNKDIYINCSGDVYLLSYINKLNTFNLCKIYESGSSLSGMMLALGYSSELFISYGAGTGGGGIAHLEKFGEGSVYTKTVSLDMPEDKKAAIKCVYVTFRNATSGGLGFRLDASLDGGSLVTFIPTTYSITDLKIKKYRRSDGGILGTFNNLSLNLQWKNADPVASSSAPIIDKIEVFFEPINI